jgi:hypothetical protein
MTNPAADTLRQAKKGSTANPLDNGQLKGHKMQLLKIWKGQGEKQHEIA